MPSNIKLRVRINGGSWQTGPVQGGIVVVANDVVEFSYLNAAGATSYRTEIFDYPTGYATPSGWTLDVDGRTIYTTNPTPPSITIPSSSTIWGGWIFVGTVDGGKRQQRRGGAVELVAASDLIDASVGLYKDGGTLLDTPFLETNQFDQLRQAYAAMKANWRTLQGLIIAGGGEANTLSSISSGLGGSSIVSGKVGADLRVRPIAPGNELIDVVIAGNDLTIAVNEDELAAFVDGLAETLPLDGDTTGAPDDNRTVGGTFGTALTRLAFGSTTDGRVVARIGTELKTVDWIRVVTATPDGPVSADKGSLALYKPTTGEGAVYVNTNGGTVWTKLGSGPSTASLTGRDGVAVSGGIASASRVVHSATISTTTNDYAGGSTADAMYIDPVGDQSLTGLAAPGPSDTRERWIHNTSGSYSLLLQHRLGSVSAAQFDCPGDAPLELAPGMTARVLYRDSSAKWQVVSGGQHSYRSGGAIGADAVINPWSPILHATDANSGDATTVPDGRLDAVVLFHPDLTSWVKFGLTTALSGGTDGLGTGELRAWELSREGGSSGSQFVPGLPNGANGGWRNSTLFTGLASTAPAPTSTLCAEVYPYNGNQRLVVGFGRASAGTSKTLFKEGQTGAETLVATVYAGVEGPADICYTGTHLVAVYDIAGGNIERASATAGSPTWANIALGGATAAARQFIASNGNGTLIAVGSSAASLVRSTDHGATWANATIGVTGTIISAVRHGEAFLITNSVGQSYRSGDGDSWFTCGTPVFAHKRITTAGVIIRPKCVAVCGDYLCALVTGTGIESASGGTDVFYSQNARDWYPSGAFGEGLSSVARPRLQLRSTSQRSPAHSDTQRAQLMLVPHYSQPSSGSDLQADAYMSFAESTFGRGTLGLTTDQIDNATSYAGDTLTEVINNLVLGTGSAVDSDDVTDLSNWTGGNVTQVHNEIKVVTDALSGDVDTIEAELAAIGFDFKTISFGASIGDSINELDISLDADKYGTVARLTADVAGVAILGIAQNSVPSGYRLDIYNSVTNTHAFVLRHGASSTTASRIFNGHQEAIVVKPGGGVSLTRGNSGGWYATGFPTDNSEEIVVTIDPTNADNVVDQLAKRVTTSLATANTWMQEAAAAGRTGTLRLVGDTVTLTSADINLRSAFNVEARCRTIIRGAAGQNRRTFLDPRSSLLFGGALVQDEATSVGTNRLVHLTANRTLIDVEISDVILNDLNGSAREVVLVNTSGNGDVRLNLRNIEMRQSTSCVVAQYFTSQARNITIEYHGIVAIGGSGLTPSGGSLHAYNNTTLGQNTISDTTSPTAPNPSGTIKVLWFAPQECPLALGNVNNAGLTSQVVDMRPMRTWRTNWPNASAGGGAVGTFDGQGGITARLSTMQAVVTCAGAVPNEPVYANAEVESSARFCITNARCSTAGEVIVQAQYWETLGEFNPLNYAGSGQFSTALPLIIHQAKQTA